MVLATSMAANACSQKLLDSIRLTVNNVQSDAISRVLLKQLKP